MTERKDLEAWADALLEQHRTAPKTEPAPKRTLLDELDQATRLKVEALAAPAAAAPPRPSVAADPDEWVGKAQAMGAVLVCVLLLSLALALLAS